MSVHSIIKLFFFTRVFFSDNINDDSRKSHLSFLSEIIHKRD